MGKFVVYRKRWKHRGVTFEVDGQFVEAVLVDQDGVMLTFDDDFVLVVEAED